MKKTLLTMVALGAITFSAVSQQRMTLHEEFTGENCGPCAATNPAFWALLDGTTNPTKVIHISYMDNIPSAGFYCNRTTAIYTTLNSYYSVPFAPYGRYDGHVPDPTAGTPPGSDGGHPYYFTQADIDAEYAIASPFNITVTNAWNAAFDSVTATIHVTCVSAYSGTLFLRTVLAETNNFVTSPGSNGETHFENVVQAAYPNITGTSIPGTWTVGMSNTYTISGPVPSYVDKSGSPYIVCWIQNDVDKSIQQAAQATTPLSIMAHDVSTTGTAGPAGLTCATGTYTAAHTMTLRNSGSATLTSATIYYSVDGGAYTAFPWTGSLATGATATVTMPSVSITVNDAGYHSIADSVGMPNGATAINQANNYSISYFFVENTAGSPMPYTTSFEDHTDTGYYFTDVTGNGATWGIWQTGTSGVYLGHSGTYAAGFPLLEYPTGTENSIVLPEVKITDPAHTRLSFWVSYSQQATGNTDKLEVVYSSDCGSTWTSLWNLSGATMVTLPSSTSGFSYPTSPSMYKKWSTPLSGVTAGSVMLGFRGTQGGGNFLVVDDINIYTSTAVNNVAATSEQISIFPNPANSEATVSFNLTDQSNVQVQVVDALGRVMNQVTNEVMEAGAHTLTLNTSSLASGVYNLVIHTNGGVNTEHFTVIR